MFGNCIFPLHMWTCVSLEGGSLSGCAGTAAAVANGRLKSNRRPFDRLTATSYDSTSCCVTRQWDHAVTAAGGWPRQR